MNELKRRVMKKERKGKGGTKSPHLMTSLVYHLELGLSMGQARTERVPSLAAVLLGSSMAVLENK